MKRQVKFDVITSGKYCGDTSTGEECPQKDVFGTIGEICALGSMDKMLGGKADTGTFITKDETGNYVRCYNCFKVFNEENILKASE